MKIMKDIKKRYHRFLTMKEVNKLNQKYKTNEPKEFKSHYKTLFISNNNSGGTQLFSNIFCLDNDCLQLIRAGGDDSVEYFYLIDQSEKIDCLLSKRELSDIFNIKYDYIILNTLVKFTSIDFFITKLIQYKKNTPDCKLIYMIHDFHCISPNCNLFFDGHYCAPNDSAFPEKVEYYGRLISSKEWQEKWSRILLCCDEIRCFSQSSKEIIRTAYHEIDNSQITVVPHSMSYCQNTPIKGVDSLPLNIGVVGACFVGFKGKEVVSELIKKYGNDVPITLIGSSKWRFMLFRKKVKYLGPYNRDELQNIIKKEKVSCVLFPSLWPETFSYVVSELMMMDIPIICFDYGAQAEKVYSYKKGIVCKNTKDLWRIIDNKVKHNPTKM